MKRKQFMLPTAALLIGLCSAPAPAYNVATEFTQVLNQIQLALQYTQMLDSYQEDIKMVQYQIRLWQGMERNLRGLRHALDRGGVRDLRRMFQIIRSTRGMAERSAQSMRDTIGRYGDIYRDHEGHAEVSPEQVDAWAKHNHERVGSALAAARLQPDMMANEDAALDDLTLALSAGGGGQREALEALYHISAMQMEQMQKLRALIAAQIEIDSAAVATMTDRRARDEARVKGYFSGADDWGQAPADDLRGEWTMRRGGRGG